MSYTPTEWNSGDVITAEKLNKIENGIAGSGTNSDSSPIIVEAIWNYTGGYSTLNKTWKEINDSFAEGNVIYINIPNTIGVTHAIVTNTVAHQGQYGIGGVCLSLLSSQGFPATSVIFIADNENGYPNEVVQEET